MKRLFDIVSSLFTLILLGPFLLLLLLLLTLEGYGGAFFTQTRVGKDGKHFKLLKFRTMRPASEKQGLLSLGEKDPRITPLGGFLRKYKLDELPQLVNILKGDMSVVGPRPEVPRYVDMYTVEQRKVLSVRPGLTDYASLQYFEEGELLAKSGDPEKTYVEEVLPQKLELALEYVEKRSFWMDMRIIGRTIARITGRDE